MTYLKTTLIATALTAATSSIAFAGEGMKKDYNKDAKMMEKTTITKTSTMSEVRGATATTLTKANDTVGEILQADGQPDTQSDYELLTHDGDMLTKAEAKTMDSDKTIANNAIVVPSSTGAITTVNCPIGTTAQPDMTCHVTGNYDLETSENLRKQELKSDKKVLGAVSYDAETEMDMTSSNWTDKSDWDANSDRITVEYDPEYKGTLRPDTVVTSNID